MGYFSNGSEGLDYQHNWCRRCVHRDDDKAERYCPILALHYDWNYESCEDDELGKAKRAALNAFPAYPVADGGRYG